MFNMLKCYFVVVVLDYCNCLVALHSFLKQLGSLCLFGFMSLLLVWRPVVVVSPVVLRNIHCKWLLVRVMRVGIRTPAVSAHS